MSGWSIGFGQSLGQGTGASASDVFNNSQREKKKRSQDFEAASDFMKSEAIFNGSPRESRASAAFCTKDNLLNSIAYVNQELELLGLPCLKFESGKCTADIYFYINRIHDLLVLYHKTVSVKEDLEVKNHRLSCEANHHQSTCARLRRDQSQIERDLAQETEKTRQVSLKCKQLSNKLKAEREEVKRLTAVLQSRDVQHRHDNKKKEREVIGLKERLHQLLADKVPDRKVGMDLMNVLSTGEGRRGTWKVGKGKQEEEMYQLVISNYEERHQELMLENADLRDCLLFLQKELSGLLKRTGNIAAPPALELQRSHSLSMSSEEDIDDHSPHSRLSVTDLDEGYIQMPFDIVRKEIERAFKDTCDQISEGVKKSLTRNVSKCHPSPTKSKPVGSRTPDRDGSEKRQSIVDIGEVERLKKQITNYKDIIQQQEELIQQSLHSHSQSVETTFLHESQLLKEKENLSEQKKLFFEEKSAFEKERRALTDAAIRLGKERQALQDERSNLLRQHLQNISPMKENQQPKLKGDTHQPARQLPATPVLSPATSGRSSGVTTPAKVSNAKEMFKALSFVPISGGQTDAKQPDSLVRQNTSASATQVFQSSPTIHFTPSTAVVTTVGGATKEVTATSPPTTAATGDQNLSSFNAAASLESIRASLLRIRKSASQQE